MYARTRARVHACTPAHLHSCKLADDADLHTYTLAHLLLCRRAHVAPLRESWAEHPAVARKRPRDDRREMYGESGRSLCGQGFEAEFQSQWGGQRGVLVTLTAAETVVRQGAGIVFYFGPDRFDLQFATKGLAQDMQTSSIVVDAEAQTVCMVSL